MTLARDHLVVLYEVHAVDVVAVPVGLREAALPQEAAADDALKVALVNQALQLPERTTLQLWASMISGFLKR